MVEIIAPPDSALAPASLPQPPTSESSGDRLTIGDQSAVDSGAITQSAIRNVTPPQHANANSGPSNAVAPVDEAGRTLPPPPQDQTRAPNGNPESVPSEVDDYRREIEGVWQSEATQRKKQLALVTLLSLFGLVSAGIVFSQFVRTWRAQQSASQSTSTEKPDSTDELDATEKNAVNPSTSIPSETPTETPTENPLESTTSSPIAPSVEPLPIKPPGSEDTYAAPASAPSPNGIGADMPSGVPPLVVSPFAPVGEKPKDAPELGGVPSAETIAITGDRDSAMIAPAAGNLADDNRPDPPPMNALPPGLAQYLPMANLLTAGNQAAEPMQPPPTIDSVRIDEAAMAAEPEADTVVKREPINLESVLAQRFAIGNQGATLADLLLVISSLTTVPVELELLALDASGIKVDVPIKTPSGWMSAKQWIDNTCAGLGLVAIAMDGRIMVSVNEDKLNAELAVAFQLDDFGDQSREIFEWIRPLLKDEETLVPEEAADDEQVAAVTSLSEDGQTIIPGTSLRSRMQALFAIESARMIRGMPTKLERWRTSRWMGPWDEKHQPTDETTIGEWPVVSGGKAVPVLDAPHAAAGLMKSIASINGAQLLVGWFDATRLGFFPADPMMPYSRDNASGAVLEEMLGEPGLQARVIGPSLWYVCSEASYDRFEVFAWFTIPSGTGEAVRQRLANSLSADPASLPVVFTDTTLLVRCPRYIARQMPRIIEP